MAISFIMYGSVCDLHPKKIIKKEEIVPFPRCLNWISNLPMYTLFKKASATCGKDWAWSLGLVQDKVSSNLCCNKKKKKKLHQLLQMSLIWCNEEKTHILDYVIGYNSMRNEFT